MKRWYDGLFYDNAMIKMLQTLYTVIEDYIISLYQILKLENSPEMYKFEKVSKKLEIHLKYQN